MQTGRHSYLLDTPLVALVRNAMTAVTDGAAASLGNWRPPGGARYYELASRRDGPQQMLLHVGVLLVLVTLVIVFLVT